MEISHEAENIIAKAPQWNLQGDCSLLQWMQGISQHLEQKATNTNKALQELSLSVNRTAIALENATGHLTALQHKQFVENRVRDDDDLLHKKGSSPVDENKPAEISKADVLNTFLQNNVQVLHTFYDKYTLQFEHFDGENTENNYVYQLKNPYNERLLPHIYGSKLWKENWHVGLCDEVNHKVAGETASETFSETSIMQTQQSDSQSLHYAWESNNSMEIPPNNLKIQNASLLQDSERDLFSDIKSHDTQTQPGSDTYSTQADLFSSIENIPRPPIPIPTPIKPSIRKEDSIDALNRATANETKNLRGDTASTFHDNNKFNTVISEIVDRVTKKDKIPQPTARKLSIPKLPEVPATTPRQQALTVTLPAVTNVQANKPQATFVNLFDSSPDSPVHDKKLPKTPSAPSILKKLEVPNTANEISKSSKFSAKNLFDDDYDDDDDFLTAFGNKTVKPVAKIERTNLFEDNDEENIFSSTLKKSADLNEVETTRTKDNILFEIEPPPLDQPKIKHDEKHLKAYPSKIADVSEKTAVIMNNDFKKETTHTGKIKFKDSLFGNDDDYKGKNENLTVASAETERVSEKQVTNDAVTTEKVESLNTSSKNYEKPSPIKEDEENPFTLDIGSIKTRTPKLEVSLFGNDDDYNGSNENLTVASAETGRVSEKQVTNDAVTTEKVESLNTSSKNYEKPSPIKEDEENPFTLDIGSIKTRTPKLEVSLFGNDDDYNGSNENLTVASAETGRVSEKQVTNDAVTTEKVEDSLTSSSKNYEKPTPFKEDEENPFTLDIGSIKTRTPKLKVSLFGDEESDEENELFINKNFKAILRTNITESKTKHEDLFNDDLHTGSSSKEKLEKQQEKAQAVNISENFENLRETGISDENSTKKNDMSIAPKKPQAIKASDQNSEDSFYNKSLNTDNIENQYLSVSGEIPTTINKTKEHQYASIFSDEPPEDVDDFSIIPNSNLTTKMAKKTTEDSQVQDFYESPITRSVTSEKTVKPSSHEIDYGALHLFSDIPPDDDFEDIENVKTASKRLRGIFEENSNLQPANIENSALMKSEVKSTDVTDKVMPAKPVGAKQISKLQMPEIKISVQALLPNAGGMSKIKATLEKQQKDVEKLSSHDFVAEISKEVPQEDNTKLSHMCKERVRLPANRRPSTRRARHANYQQTLLETAVALNVEEPEITAKQTDATKLSMEAVLRRNSPPPLVNSSVLLHHDSPTPLMIEQPIITEEVASTSKVVKKREISNIFLDDNDDEDDLFFNTNPSIIKPKPFQKKHAEEFSPVLNVSENLTKSMPFVDSANSDSENIFDKKDILVSDIAIISQEILQMPNSQLKPKKKSLFFDEDDDTDDNDDYLFKSTKPTSSPLVNSTQKQETIDATKVQRIKKETSLFGSSDEDDGFLNKGKDFPKVSNLNPQKSQKLFNDDFNIGDSDDDDDDLFSSTKTTNKNKIYKPLPTIVSSTTKSFEIKKQTSLSDNPLADLF